ncbi:glycosyltransferase family 8 protein [Amanita thiersii Skay4041]|uniref:Glycosyltransferase family 8 protein n=1 Tax=Amanita thiersii Skay4041 TaxID=703135 RepID=A0A2A9P1G8_9AGAR|nr:glycosyltransferase family 8 protein [Amanita thiersii Skay4041]
MNPSKAAYVTLLTRKSYLPGALVLNHGLRAAQSMYPLVVMFTSSLSEDARDILLKQNIRLREVEPLNPKGGFELDEYERIVLLDCDMVIRKNMDELMNMDLARDEIAAVHVCACNPRKLPHYPADWIPENCAHSTVPHPTALPPAPANTAPRPYSQLNGGTVVLNPSKDTATAVYEFLNTCDKVPSFSFPDQDFLTVFFAGKWKPLPWYYNALKTMRHLHPNCWSDDEVRCVHYILPDKPWHMRITPSELYNKYGVLNSWWWEQFDMLRNEIDASNPEGWKLLASMVNQDP